MKIDTLHSWLKEAKRNLAIDDLDEIGTSGIIVYRRDRKLSDGINYEFHFIMMDQKGEKVHIGLTFEDLNDIKDLHALANDILNTIEKNGTFKVELVQYEKFKIISI